MDLSKYRIEWVPVSAINAQDKRFQFRVSFTTEDLEESFREKGQKEPIILWRRDSGSGASVGTGGLVVISGQRRFKTASNLKFEKVMAIVIPESDLSEQDAENLNIDDNIRRKSLTETDLMNVCIRKLKRGYSIGEVSRITGKSRAMVSNYRLIAETGPEVLDAIKNRRISIFNAIRILRSGAAEQRSLPEAGTPPSMVDGGVSDNTELKRKWHENSMKLLEALNSPDPQKSVQNLLFSGTGTTVSIDNIPGFLDRFRQAVTRRKNFDKAEGHSAGDEQGANEAETRQWAGDMYVKQTSRGCEMRLCIDIKKDTLADLCVKEEFLRKNAKYLESSIRELEKAYKSHKLKADRQAKQSVKQASKEAADKASKKAAVQAAKQAEARAKKAVKAAQKAWAKLQDTGAAAPAKLVDMPPAPITASEPAASQPASVTVPDPAPAPVQSQTSPDNQAAALSQQNAKSSPGTIPEKDSAVGSPKQQPGQAFAEEPEMAAPAAHSSPAISKELKPASFDITGLNITESSIQMSGVSMSEKKLNVGGSVNLYVRGDLNGKWFELPKDCVISWKADRELHVLPGPSHIFTIQLREPVGVFACFEVTALDKSGKKIEAGIMISSD